MSYPIYWWENAPYSVDDFPNSKLYRKITDLHQSERYKLLTKLNSYWFFNDIKSIETAIWKIDFEYPEENICKEYIRELQELQDPNDFGFRVYPYLPKKDFEEIFCQISNQWIVYRIISYYLDSWTEHDIKKIDHFFERFWIDMQFTENGIIPRQSKEITEDIYIPVLQKLSDKKYIRINSLLSDTFLAFREWRYNEVNDKSMATLHWFLQIYTGEELWDNWGWNFSKIIARLKREDHIDGIFLTFLDSYMQQKRTSKGLSKPTDESETKSGALLTINFIMISIEYLISVSN